MIPENPLDALARMEAMLRHCRRCILMADVRVQLRNGVKVYLRGLLGLAALFLLLRGVTYTVRVPIGIHGAHLFAMAVILAVGLFGHALWRAFRGHPVHVNGAAERLDLSQSTHNRIATAIALLHSGDDSFFATEAIRDGFEYLEKLQAESPHVDTPSASWRREGLCLALSLALIVAGQFFEAERHAPGGGTSGGPVPAPVAPLDPPAAAPPPDNMVEPKERAVRPNEAQPRRDAPPREDDRDDRDTGKRAEPGKESRSEGPSGQHASGKSRSSESSSSSRSAASGAGAKSDPGKTEPSKSKKPRQAVKQPGGQPKIEQKSEKGGSINARGSSGSGSMRTTQNEWSSKVQAKASDSEDFEQEEEPDEDMDSDKQRLGVQPTLKSRTSRLSRELSLGMGNGLNNDMMKGRGGPGAQKKSRGTASMVMGVPVPGFVRGRLLPGPTKSTQEEVEPSPHEGAYAGAAERQQAFPEEIPQERYRPMAALGARARDYLINYHAEHENKQNGAMSHE